MIKSGKINTACTGCILGGFFTAFILFIVAILWVIILPIGKELVAYLTENGVPAPLTIAAIIIVIGGIVGIFIALDDDRGRHD